MNRKNFFVRNIKNLLKPFFIISLKIGFDPRRLVSLRYYSKYLSQTKRFESLGGVITHRRPVLSEYNAQAGSVSGHYFHQDLLVATFIYARRPLRHVDIGSRIDGFVAHVASFRKIDVMDIRDLKSTGHENISFLKADLMNEDIKQRDIADSISCLHAIEHFGLGRYDDPIDPNGHIRGFHNILQMLKPGGMLYISFPIGKTNEVHFNAHRVFHPKDIFNWIPDHVTLQLQRFDFVDDKGDLYQNVDLANSDIDASYGCGIYTFQKLKI